MKRIAATLVLMALTATAASQNWRVLTAREVIALDNGPPISLPAGVSVRGNCVPAVLNLPARTFDATACAFIFRGGFER